MARWIKSLRLPLCIVGSLLALVSFKIVGVKPNFLAVLAVLFIACSTMLQNDWRDRYHDQKKDKTLALDQPNKFRVLLLFFWFISLALTMLVLLVDFKMAIIPILMIVAGLVYSETRTIPLLPTLVVALTSASPVLLPFLSNEIELEKLFLPFVLIVSIIFGRELTKDIDDQIIDKNYKWTIPLYIGDRWARIIATMFIMIGLLLLIYFFSAPILVGLSISIIGVFILLITKRTKTFRIFLDCGLAIAVLTLIFI